ncbi:hypothetical protein KFL_000360080 [Klebsormidium nitens]|uniref:Uncharacterized protein n=1 Tax=Klebsormidium nitens TaxID=105231 RepID=A0A1Y1HPI5_KLENI|nr:hypothetical protein KFL_000360080 [Klebsormidium nitens]|eukprot:GAQ79692.1 hypothetical protein KFL_000360080 [Klebsormidium nitens]
MATREGADDEEAEQSSEADPDLLPSRVRPSAEDFSNGVFSSEETSRQQAGSWRMYSNSVYDNHLRPVEEYRGVVENGDRSYEGELRPGEIAAAEANGFVTEDGRAAYSREIVEVADDNVGGASYNLSEASSEASSANEEGGSGRSTPVGLYPGLVPGLPAQMFMSGYQYPFFPTPFFPTPGLQPGMGIPIGWPGASPFFNPFMQLPIQPASPSSSTQASEPSSPAQNPPEAQPEQQPKSTATQPPNQPPNPGLNPSAASWSPPSQIPPRPQQQPQPQFNHPPQMAGEAYPPDWQRHPQQPPPARGQRPPLAPQWPPSEAPQFNTPAQAPQFNAPFQAPQFGPYGQFQRPPRPHLSPAAPPFVANQQFPRGRMPGTDQRPPLAPRGPQYFTPRPQNMWFQRPQQPPPRPAPVQRALPKVDSTKLRIMSRELQSNMQTELPKSRAAVTPEVPTDSARRETWQRRPTLEALSEEGSEVEEGQARSEEAEADSDSTGWSGRSVTKEPSATDLVAFASADGEESTEAVNGAPEPDAEGKDNGAPTEAAESPGGKSEAKSEPEEDEEVLEREKPADSVTDSQKAETSQEPQGASDGDAEDATASEVAAGEETLLDGAEKMATEQQERETESDRTESDRGGDAASESAQAVVEVTAMGETDILPAEKASVENSEASANQCVGKESVTGEIEGKEDAAIESSEGSVEARVEGAPDLPEEGTKEDVKIVEASSKEEQRSAQVEEAKESPPESENSLEEERAAVREGGAEAAPEVGAERAECSGSSEESDARSKPSGDCSSNQQVEAEVVLESQEGSEEIKEQTEADGEADADGRETEEAGSAQEKGEEELEVRKQPRKEEEQGEDRLEGSGSGSEVAEGPSIEKEDEKPSSAQAEPGAAAKADVVPSEGQTAEAAEETEIESPVASSLRELSEGGVEAASDFGLQPEAEMTSKSEEESRNGSSEASQLEPTDVTNKPELPSKDFAGGEAAEETRSVDADADADVSNPERGSEVTAEVASRETQKTADTQPEAERTSSGGIPSSVLSMLLPHFGKPEGVKLSFGEPRGDEVSKEASRPPTRFTPKLGPPPGFEMHRKTENGSSSRSREMGGGEGEIDDLLKVLIGGGSGGTDEGQSGGAERQSLSKAGKLEVAAKIEAQPGQSLEHSEVSEASVVGPDFWKEMLGLATANGEESGSAEPDRKAEDGGEAPAGREAKEAREKTWEELFDEMQAKAARGEPLLKPDSEKTWEELEADGKFVGGIPQKMKTGRQQLPPSEDDWKVKVGPQMEFGKGEKPGERLARAVIQEAFKAKKAELEKVKIKAWSKPEVFAPEESPDQSEAPRGRDGTRRAEDLQRENVWEKRRKEAEERLTGRWGISHQSEGEEGPGELDRAVLRSKLSGSLPPKEWEEAGTGSARERGSIIFEGALVQLKRQSSKERRGSESNPSSPERRQGKPGRLLLDDGDKGAQVFAPLAKSNGRRQEAPVEPLKSPKTPKSGQWSEMVEQSEDDLPSLPDVLKEAEELQDSSPQPPETEGTEHATGRVIQTGHVPQNKAVEAEVATRADGERTAFRAAAMGASATMFAGLAERSRAAARLALGGAHGDRPPTGDSAHGSTQSEPSGWNVNRPTTGGSAHEHVQSGPSRWPGAGNAGGIVAPDDLEEDDSEAEEFARLRKLRKPGANQRQGRPVVERPAPQPAQPVESKPKAVRITAPHEIEDEEASDVEEVGRATRKGKRYSQKQFITDLESGGGYYDRTWVEAEQGIASQNRGPPQALGQRNFNQKPGPATQSKGLKRGSSGRVGERFVGPGQFEEADRVSSPRPGTARERAVLHEPGGLGRRNSTPPQSQEWRPVGEDQSATSSRTPTPETLPSTPSGQRAHSRASPVSLSTEASPIESVKSSLSVKSPRESLSDEEGYESATSSVFDNNDDKWSTEDQSEGPSSQAAAPMAGRALPGRGGGEVSTGEQQEEAEARVEGTESAPCEEEGGFVAAVRAAVRQIATGNGEEEAREGGTDTGWTAAEKPDEKEQGGAGKEEGIEEPIEDKGWAEGEKGEEGNAAAVPVGKREEKTGPLSEEELQRRTIWVGNIPEKLFTEKKLWEHFRNLGLKVMSIRLINSRTLTTRDGVRIEGAAFMCLKDEDAAMDALLLFKKDRAPFRNMLLRPRTPAVYEARGWVPGPGQFAAPPPKAVKTSLPTEKGPPGRTHRVQEAAEARASNRMPGSQQGRMNGSEDGFSEAEEPQFWELPPTSAQVDAPAKKGQLPVRPAGPPPDEEARARARRLEKERQILADHVKFRDWEERVRQQRAEAERAEAAARRGRAKAGKKVGEKPAPRRGETNPVDFADSPPFARFFVAIGNSREDLENSLEHSAWTSVTRTGNKKMDMAYRRLQEGEGAGPLYLFLTVNASGVFCGVAEMTGRVKDEALDIWQESPWGGHFPVKWHLVVDVPGTLLEHILLTNNDRKPVTVSRDMQEVPFEQGLEMLQVFKAEAIKAAPPPPLPAPEEPIPQTASAEPTNFVDWDTLAVPTPEHLPTETEPQLPDPGTPAPADPHAETAAIRVLTRVRETKGIAPRPVPPKAPQPKDEANRRVAQTGRIRVDTPLKWWPAAEASRGNAEKAHGKQKGAETDGTRKDETSGKRNAAAGNGDEKKTGGFALLEVESPAASESSSDEEGPRQPTEPEEKSVPVVPEQTAESSGNGAQEEWDELFLGGAQAEDERLGDVPKEEREEALAELAKGLIGRLPAKGVDARDADGCTALMHALLQGRLQLASFLLQSGARADYPTKDGLNALHVKEKPILIVHVSPSLSIAQVGSSELCALALARIRESGGQQGLAKAVNKPDNRGRSPLTIAAQYGWAAVVDQLIESGARADESQHRDGATALFKAAELGQVEAVAMLLAKGANPTPPPVNGLTPLDVAKQYGHKRTAATLAAAGAIGELPKRVEALCNRGLESARACDKKEGPGLKFRTCGRCREMRYCSKECQVNAWPEHKPFCRERE